MFTAILIDDFFVDPIWGLGFLEDVCATTCMELTNMSFVSLFVYFLLSKKLNMVFHFNSNLTKILFLLLIYLLYVSTFGYDLLNSLFNFRRFAQFFLIYLVTIYFITRRDGLSGSITILVLFSLTCAFFGLTNLLTRVSGERIYAGSLLLFSLPILTALLNYRILKSGLLLAYQKYWSELVVIAGSVALLFQSESRRNLIVVGVIGIFVFFRLRLHRRVIAIPFVAFFVWLVFNVFVSDNFSRRINITTDAVYEIFTSQRVSDDKRFDFYTGRDILYRVTLDIFNENQLFGIGLNNSYAAIKERTGEAVRPHNFYLQLLVEAGIFGMAFYLVFILTAIRYLLKVRRTNLHLGFYEVAMIAEGLLLFLFIAHVIAFFGLYMLYDKFYWVVFAFIPPLRNLTQKNRRLRRLAWSNAQAENHSNHYHRSTIN